MPCVSVAFVSANEDSPGFHTGFFWWGWKKFVGHCHSVMYEYEYETTNFQVLSMGLCNFSSFLGGIEAGEPGPPTLCMKHCSPSQLRAGPVLA